VADAYFDIRFSPKFRVRTGKDKSPVGYELLVGDGFVLFPERSLASNLVPNRDVGVAAQGDVLGNKLFYSGGFFNGIPDGASTVTELDTNSGKDAIGRVVITPWRTAASPTPPLSGLGFALGGSVGQQVGALPVYRAPSLQPFFSYSGASADGQRTRVSPSVFYYHRSFGGFGEYMRSTQWVSKAGTRRQIGNTGWDATGSWVLTGETTSERGVRPRDNFDPAAGHWGAFQLLARYSELSVDEDAFTAGFAAADASERARSYGLGADWYANPFIKLYVSYEKTWYRGGANNTDRTTENLFLFRTQIAF
jgi:phosphate-selective porin OprO/OprP